MPRGTRLRIRAGTVDLVAGVVHRGGEPVGLTVTEHRLLSFLADRVGQTASRDELLAEVWGYRPGLVTRTIDNTVRRLREKIEREPSRPDHLHTVYGRGLKLVADLETPSDAPPAHRLVGREAERALAMAAFAAGERLVVVLGPPGVGKTRLADALLADLADRLPALRVQIDGGRDDHDLVRVVGTALGVVPAAAGPIGHALRDRGPLVLLLDECESAVPALGARLPEWLAAAPALRVLATSRCPLGIDAEQRIPLGPLPLDEAVALFCDRARRVSPTFRIAGNEAAIADLVTAVDRLPLTIELAAARVGAVPVARMCRMLDRRLDLLAVESDHPRGIRATLDWSFALLGPVAHETLRQLAVFAASFTLDDAEAVLGGSWVLDRVQSLVDRGLVALTDDPDARYTLYEVVRDRVRELGALDPGAVGRHAAWFARLARDDGPPPERSAFPELRAALDRTRADDPALAGRAAYALIRGHATSGPLAATFDTVRELEDLGGDPQIVGLGLAALAMVHDTLGNGDLCEDALQRGLAIATAPRTVFALHLVQARAVHRPELAGPALDGCRRVLDHLSDAERAAFFVAQGEVAWLQGEVEQAVASFQRAGQLGRRCGQTQVVASCAVYTAGICCDRGRWTDALRLCREALEVTESGTVAPKARASLLRQIASVERQLGLLDDAERHLDAFCALAAAVGAGSLGEAEQRAWIQTLRGDPAAACARLGDPEVERVGPRAAWALGSHAEIYWLAGRIPDARRAAEQATRIARDAGLSGLLVSMEGVGALVSAADGDLAGGRARLAGAEVVLVGRGLLGELAKQRAMAAELEARWGDPEAAATALGRARGLADELEAGRDSELAMWIRRVAAFQLSNSPG